MERDARPQSLLYTSSRVPSKGAPLPGCPHIAPSERDTPFLEHPAFISQESLVNEPPYRFPSRVPMERDAHHHSLPVHNLQSPQ